MATIFEKIQTEGIAEISYLLGDDGKGVAAIFDATRDVEKYVKLAKERNLVITHIFETHIHADFVSGSRELENSVGGARIYLSAEGGAEYDFDFQAIRDGDTFEIGDTRIIVRHTPGHTPEHVSYELVSKSEPDSPWGVLSGDSLFVGSAGRPDLLGEETTEKLTEELFHTLRNYYLGLPDGTLIYPAHGQGSPCGADIGDRLHSTIGYEKRTNPFLQYNDLGEFKQFVLGGTPPTPTYYPRMKAVNSKGPEILGASPKIEGLLPDQFEEAMKDEVQVIDTRHMLAFGAGHIAGSMNIGSSPMLSIWAGWLLDPEEPILLIADSDMAIDELVTQLSRTGYTNFAGYLAGGINAWIQAGKTISHLGEQSVHEVNAILSTNGSEVQLVDVRTPSEWKEGHIPGAMHLFLPELEEEAVKLDKSRITYTYCASGYRASIAASILAKMGFENVVNIPGSWKAWKATGFAVEKGELR
ncbi:rhodanese-like domain-containing protein [Luteolibacter algae]|uniref:Rhodanese-like domain-containing protein n=1 Tax=Luteolibacter algae TaxID=454151 RepID=A0ABW5DB06_9BACT